MVVLSSMNQGEFKGLRLPELRLSWMIVGHNKDFFDPFMGLAFWSTRLSTKGVLRCARPEQIVDCDEEGCAARWHLIEVAVLTPLEEKMDGQHARS